MLRLSPPYPATAVRPNVAFWILCLPHFALARRGMVPQVRDILPCCQIPFAPSSCAAAATRCLSGRQWPGCVWAPAAACSLPACAAGTARLSVLGAAVGPASSAVEQLPGSLQQVPGEQLLPDGEGSCSPGMWRWAEACAVEVGCHRGSQNPDPAVTAAGVRPPCKGFRRPSPSSCITAFWKQLLGLSQMPWSLSALRTSFLLNCFLSNYFASFIKVEVTVQE